MQQEFSAPARVNLLGEHTDYTGGLVLPMAIPFHTTVHVEARGDAHYTFASEQLPEVRAMSTTDRSDAAGNWTDYPVGVLRQLQARGIELPAFTLRFRGNVPLSSGLSSSASIEVAAAYAMLALAGKTLPIEDVAVACQHAENEYVHSPCGIMDQFVVVAAQAKHALLLHTRTLAYEHLPMAMGDVAGTAIVICNSMVTHSVASGAYGQRRQEVEAGQAAVLMKFPGLLDLGEATPAQVEACADAMPRASYLRCRHIVTENARVRAAKEAMLAGDAKRLGELMLGSHNSQRDDFQCSTPEIDLLVETASAFPGCYGARLTGGGFGGCTVSLVKKDRASALESALKQAYRQRFQRDAETYVCEAADGAANANGVGVKGKA